MRRPLYVVLGVLILWILFCYDPPDEETTKNIDKDHITLYACIDEMSGFDNHVEVVVRDVTDENGSFFCKRLRLTEGRNKNSTKTCDLTGYAIGNILCVSGAVQGFQKPGNPGQFDEFQYYLNQDICARMFVNDVYLVDGHTDYFASLLYRLRTGFYHVLQKVLPEKEAGICAAMLLGEKAGLSNEVKELYRENGLAHILAISGLHISLVGMGLYYFLRKTILPMRVAAVTTMGILFLYGELTGFSIATRRAVGMMVVLLFARIIGKKFDRFNALALAAITELLIYPGSLMQSGFLLSYGTVAGILYFSDAWEMLVSAQEDGRSGGRRNKTIEHIGDIICSSLGIWLITLPIVIQCYHEVPVYSVIVNIVLLPFLSILIASAFFGGSIAILSLSVSRFMVGIAYYTLILYEWICRCVSLLPHPVWIVGHRNAFSIVLYYIILFIIRTAIIHIKNKSIKPLIACMLLVNVWLLTYPVTEDGTIITNLDVGQGDCACIRVGDHTVLIDGGSSDVSEVGKYRIVPYLKYMGIDKIDYMIITHSDTDHISGLSEIIEKDDHFGLEISHVVLPFVKDPDEAYCTFENLCKSDTSIKTEYMQMGDTISFGDVKITCLHPVDGYEWEDANDYSTVNLLSYKDFRGIFMGDLGIKGEKMMEEALEKEGLSLVDVDYIKVGHHGSKNSSSEEFLSKIKPEIAAVSAGKNNRYHHPAKEAVDRLKKAGAKIYCTKDVGAITTRTDGSLITTTGFRAISP